MIIFDAHCDTITEVLEQAQSLKSNKLHNDIARMQACGSFVQIFAAFPYYFVQAADTGRTVEAVGRERVLKRALQLIDRYHFEIEQNCENIAHCTCYGDIEAASAQGKIAALLSIEGGEALQVSLPVLRIFYRLGVRSICLTWNFRNEIADGAGEGITGGGLSTFGREVVSEMNRLGMLVDVSHLADSGFRDVLEVSKQPVIASHSNSRKVCNHRRNLTDEQIIALKKNKGVMGINLYPSFLHNSGKAGIMDILKHIEHIAALAGEDILGLGADFDGIEATPDGIEGVQDIYKIFDELLKLNYSEKFVNKLAGGNFLRVFKEVCG